MSKTCHKIFKLFCENFKLPWIFEENEKTIHIKCKMWLKNFRILEQMSMIVQKIMKFNENFHVTPYLEMWI